MTVPMIYTLRAERGKWCEWCNHLYSIGEIAEYERNEAQQRHHSLIPDLKRFRAELMCRENLMAACMYHHTGTCELDTREVKLWFWSVQCSRYGLVYMQTWLLNRHPKLWASGRIDREFLCGEINRKEQYARCIS